MSLSSKKESPNSKSLNDSRRKLEKRSRVFVKKLKFCGKQISNIRKQFSASEFIWKKSCMVKIKKKLK